jgi:hypothetical protein
MAGFLLHVTKNRFHIAVWNDEGSSKWNFN